MSFSEKLQAVFDKYGTTELKLYMMLNLYDDVLDCYAENQKEFKQKLRQWFLNVQPFIDDSESEKFEELLEI